MKLIDDDFAMGIVTSNGERMLAFYSDTLGFTRSGTVSFPGMGTVHKLAHGRCHIKLLVLDKEPPAANPGGGFAAATGFRYCSFQVTQIEELAVQCRAAGCQIIVDPAEIRPGVKAAAVEDPDGNTLEFMQFDV
ncbi:MAG: VOC family protein [Halieaceae bacterium]|uniref:VOC family protein n=1 Tax=Haliea alexandrii TaxID=2448162 RepID=UPI000F0B5E79|nr:VOC family protein [Haliea alexandrii]MCR9184194.1 VOC family protein [Halieaceae bacterium]